ncbi:protein pxr1-like [Nicotiana tomentosiformis]|uniref:protein pxr1-like n=1 Tax=Nicotiana tomentosiformis TaxID=4098 RepID=UPI00388CBC02
MATPSKNPSSPPKETSPTPYITPSTTPTSKKGRFKMIALKVVTGGEQIKKINEQLKSIAENLENKFVLVRTMVGIETTKSGKISGKDKKKNENESEGDQGVVRGKELKFLELLGKIRREKLPLLSLWKLLLQEEGLQGVRRSRVTELEKALEESKRKVVAKGKKKVGEPVEVVEIEEMVMVLRDEDKAEEEEVATPNTKKRKTFKKTSPSKKKSAEPSTLAKRTRSTIKSRNVKEVEEEESEDEEETDQEQNKKEKFVKRIILKGRLLRELEEEGMAMLGEKLQLQG